MTGVPKLPAAWRRAVWLEGGVERDLTRDVLPTTALGLNVTGWVIEADGASTLYVDGLRYAAHAARDATSYRIFGWTTIAGFDVQVEGADAIEVRLALQRLAAPFVGQCVTVPR